MAEPGQLSTPLMSAADPFYAVRDALDTEVQQLRIKFDQWKIALEGSNTATDAGFRVQHDLMKGELTKTEEKARKVKLAVGSIERARAKYPHIDDRELASRKAFVDRVEKAVLNMKEYYFGREVQAKMDSDQRKQLTQRVEVERQDAARQANAYNTANSGYLNDQSSAQATIRREQDQSLDRMGNSLDTLKEMAVAIDSELKDQEVMLNNLDTEVTEAQGMMDQALKQISKLLQTKDKCQLITIFVLVVVFIIVTAVAIS